MKKFIKGSIYLLLTSIILWLLCTLVSMLVVFSYTEQALSWIPYIILGGWAPGKWYGLTLLHSILCVAISFGIITFFDKKLEVGANTRKIFLLLIVAFFLYETIYNFFFRGSQPMEIEQYRQLALLQLSFITGILIKTFNKDAEIN